MIIWEIDTEPHFPEHFRNWGYRIRVENSGEEFMKEEYKTIEEVLVREMPSANWEYDEESQCWLVPFTMPANMNLMPRGYRVEVIIASDYKQYGSVQKLDNGINQWQTVYQGIQFGRFDHKTGLLILVGFEFLLTVEFSSAFFNFICKLLCGGQI